MRVEPPISEAPNSCEPSCAILSTLVCDGKSSARLVDKTGAEERTEMSLTTVVETTSQSRKCIITIATLRAPNGEAYYGTHLNAKKSVHFSRKNTSISSHPLPVTSSNSLFHLFAASPGCPAKYPA